MANKKRARAKAEKIINEAFQNVSIILRKRLFLELEKMAKEEFEGEESKIFLDALYQSEYTQAVQLELLIEGAIDRLYGR